MEFNQKFFKIVTAACGLAIVQGLIWAILCILGLLVYFRAWKAITDLPNDLSSVLVYIFSYQEQKILVMLILFLFVSLVWVGISISLLISIRKRLNNETSKRLVHWYAWTIWICVYDVIAVGILAADYQSVVNNFPSNDDLYSYILTAYAILFSVAARGYVLWCVNLVFAIIILIHVKNSKKKNAENINTPIDVNSVGRRYHFS